jgi:uncharacterized membrane protein YfcA
MNSKIILVIGIAAILCGSAGIATASPIDQHQINAQIFGNVNVTGGFPAFLTNQSKSGVMPQSDYITLRSPGNSTFSLTVNGSYVFRDISFTGITSQTFNIKETGTVPIVITVTSASLNYTRTFHYAADIMTSTQFVNYASSHYEHQSKPAYITSGGFIVGVLYTMAGMAMMILVTRYMIAAKRSNPNVESGRR